MSDPQLFYRPADDAFVIKRGDDIVASVSASDLMAGRVRDETASRAGVLRFLTFAEWQARHADRVLFRGGAEEAIAQLPRL